MNFRDGALTFATRLWSGVAVRRPRPPRTDAPRVYFANHTSHLDLLVLRAALPREERLRLRPAAAADYWNAGPLRRWAAENLFDAVFIERRRVTRENYPVRALADALRSDRDVLIFPEGTRGETGGPASFKSGLWHLAREMPEAEFVPVWLDNLSRALPKGEFLPLPLICGVVFGDPLPAELAADRDRFLRESRDSLVALSRR